MGQKKPAATSSSNSGRSRVDWISFADPQWGGLKQRMAYSLRSFQAFFVFPQLRASLPAAKQKRPFRFGGKAILCFVGWTGFEPATLPIPIGMRYRAQKLLID
jgi:hypothetical protein